MGNGMYKATNITAAIKAARALNAAAAAAACHELVHCLTRLQRRPLAMNLSIALKTDSIFYLIKAMGKRPWPF
jgi:hypothetical protein